MKKFYISIFAGVFLFCSLISQGQIYNSISSNPGSLTFDDPNFWVGGIPPPNPCNGCTITINTDVSMVQQGSSTAAGFNIFPTQTPAAGPINNPVTPGGPITLGTKFQPTADGYITGIRFYKGAGMGSTHTGLIWQLNPSITFLGSVNFSGETASGWQTANFGSPIAVISGRTYIVAYYAPDGMFELDNNYFTSPVTNGPLTALQDGTIFGPNGTYDNGSGPNLPATAPNGGYVAINSWVDVNFSAVINLNDMIFNNSTIVVKGTTTLNLNTYVELIGNTKFIAGTNAADQVTVYVNDQLRLGTSSTIRLGNINSYIDANNTSMNPVIGTAYANFANGNIHDAGIYGDLVSSLDGHTYSLTLNAYGIGTAVSNFNQYNLNCGGGPGFCTQGNVNGPAVTGATPSPPPDYGIIFSSSTTLPVELVQFVASKKDDGSVLLSWATSEEVNAGYYDVERSSDQSGWLKIGSVKAKGNSSTTTNYSFSDKLPIDGAGYYRLKMVDLDGKFKYSKTISVSSDNNTQALVIYSNPFHDQIRMKVNLSRAQNLNMTVTDILGKTVISKSYQAQSGNNFVNLQPAMGGSGMYILHIHGDSYDQTVKLQKQ